MKSLQLSVLALPVFTVATFLSAAAQADDSASTQFTIAGTAPKVCALPVPVATGTANNATFASNTINITQFIDPNTALVTPASLSLQFPNTMCNYSAKVSLQSTKRRPRGEQRLCCRQLIGGVSAERAIHRQCVVGIL